MLRKALGPWAVLEGVVRSPLTHEALILVNHALSSTLFLKKSSASGVTLPNKNASHKYINSL